MLIVYKAIVQEDGSRNRTFQATLDQDGWIDEWVSGPWHPSVTPHLVECGKDGKFTLFCHKDYLPVFQENPYGARN